MTTPSLDSDSPSTNRSPVEPLPPLAASSSSSVNDVGSESPCGSSGVSLLFTMVSCLWRWECGKSETSFQGRGFGPEPEIRATPVWGVSSQVVGERYLARHMWCPMSGASRNGQGANWVRAITPVAVSLPQATTERTCTFSQTYVRPNIAEVSSAMADLQAFRLEDHGSDRWPVRTGRFE